MKNLGEKERLRRFIESWQDTGRILEEMRREKIRNADTVAAIKILDSAFRSALLNRQPTQSSGLIEFQDLLKKSRNND